MSRLLKLAMLLPFSVRSLVGFCGGFCWGLLPHRDQKIAHLQQRVFLKNSSRLDVARVFGSVGSGALETLDLDPILARSDQAIQCPEWDSIKRVLQSRRGVVALTGHVGNWDLLAAYIVKRGVQLCVIGREARGRKMQQFLEALRNKYGVAMVWRADRQAVRSIHKTLRDGGVVGALIDQDTTVHSTPVEFFGRPVRTPSTLVELGLRLKVKFVSTFIVRTGFCSFKVLFRELPEGSVEEVLTAYNAHLEEVVRMHSWQWVWFHKRWRSTPNGVRLSSKDYLALLESLSRNNES